MATWHQQRNPVPLSHQTKWTLVSDPPGQCLTVMRFDRQKDANDCMDELVKSGRDAHSYLVPPRSLYQKVRH